MHLKQLPDDARQQLEEILTHFYNTKEPELIEQNKRTAREILSGWQMHGYDVRRYWDELTIFLEKAGAVILLSLLPYSSQAVAQQKHNAKPVNIDISANYMN